MADDPAGIQIENNRNPEMQTQLDAASALLKDQESKNTEFSGLFVNAAQITDLEQQRFQRDIEDKLIDQLKVQEKSKIFHMSSIIPYIRQGIQTVVNDEFSKCFKSYKSPAWNWNFYLFILWIIGVVFRYAILFPIRLILLVVGQSVLVALLLVLPVFVKHEATRAKWQRQLIKMSCSIFVLSWTAVIRYHGVIPARRPNQVYVSNHSSMIDLLVLEQMNTFAVVGQQHKGWIAFCQNTLLSCLGCVWFDRASMSNRDLTAKRIREHITNPNSNRLLIFPEGTCVNNEYCVQFKKGAFEMGAEVCPIAMKYNKIFVDAYWNSREESFAAHLLRLMTSWAVVCDVWYLEPQRQMPNESAIDFASRVKAMIAEQASLKNVDFDGYLKHFKPSQRYVEERQKLFAKSLLKKFPQASPKADESKDDEKAVDEKNFDLKKVE